jgi:hypothetical protein
MADLAALHDAFACCTTAVLQAWRGNRDPALLSLREAHAAAEEAFGPGSSEVDALGVVFAAIRQAAEAPPPGQHGPPRCSEHRDGPRPQSRNDQEGNLKWKR